MNLAVLQGRLTSNPVRKYPFGSAPVVSFSIAVPKKFKKQGAPTADFFDCTAWDKDAENIYKFFTQGDMILIRGRIENNNYTNRAGEKVHGQVIIVEEWEFGPKKRGSEENSHI